MSWSSFQTTLLTRASLTKEEEEQRGSDFNLEVKSPLPQFQPLLLQHTNDSVAVLKEVPFLFFFSSVLQTCVLGIVEEWIVSVIYH